MLFLDFDNPNKVGWFWTDHYPWSDFLKASHCKDSTGYWLSTGGSNLRGVNYKLALAIDIWHLPLEDLNHVLLYMLTLDTPWKKFRVESRNEAHCALGKTGRTVLRYSNIFRNRFYEFSSCISSYLEKPWNLSWWHLLHVISRNFLQRKYVLDCFVLPFHQNHVYTDLPCYFFGSVSQSYLTYCFPYM